MKSMVPIATVATDTNRFQSSLLTNSIIYNPRLFNLIDTWFMKERELVTSNWHEIPVHFVVCERTDSHTLCKLWPWKL